MPSMIMSTVTGFDASRGLAIERPCRVSDPAHLLRLARPAGKN
jgi:hypothetical protein